LYIYVMHIVFMSVHAYMFEFVFSCVYSYVRVYFI